MVGYLSIGVLILFMLMGMPIGFSLLLVGSVGVFYLIGWNQGLGMLRLVPYNTVASYSMSVVPLFILMGAICYNSGISRDLYNTAHKWFGHMPGGLAVGTVGATAAFSAVNGSSLATAATMGMVALPEMRRYKYSDALATGAVAAGGTMGSLIPPSVGLIMFGLIGQQSIGRLFAAGFIPGFLEAVFYMGTIYILCKHNPLLGPPAPKTSLMEKIVSLKDTWVVIALFVVVIGGIYAGVFTPTEAGAIGAAGALIFALARKRLTKKTFFDSLFEAIRTMVLIFVIMIGAMIYVNLLALSQLPWHLAEFITSLGVNRYFILGIILLTLIFLGCFMEFLGVTLLTVPIFMPVIISLNFDPIWFGILFARTAEIGMITPPLGLNVFIIKGVAPDVKLSTIFRGIVPFLIADILNLSLLVAIPEITLFLPNLFYK